MTTDQAVLGSETLRVLQEALRQKRLIPVVGAGVAIAAANLPGWLGLIAGGIAYAEECGGCEPSDIEAARAHLNRSDLLGAAKALKVLLKAPNGQYAAWLESVFELGSDAIVSKVTLNSIADLLCPIIATTNYDDLIERTLFDRYETVTWREPSAMIRALKSGNAVLHLHGAYRAPETVVLGIDDYTDLTEDKSYNSVLRTIWTDRTLLFVGCSFDGLQDPDFVRMLSWFSQAFPRSSHRHFALMLCGSYTTKQREHWLHQFRVQVIPYGPTHAQLPETVRSININSEIAYAKRVRLGRDLILANQPGSASQFIAVMEGVSVDFSSSKLLQSAVVLFDQHRTDISRRRQNFAAMQLLMKTLIDPVELRRMCDDWKRYGTRYEGDFRKTAQAAWGAISLFEPTMLRALKRRGLQLHGNLLSGKCQAMFEELERLPSDHDLAGSWQDSSDWYHYQVENIKRLMSSTLALIEASPSETFPDLRLATANLSGIANVLIVTRELEIELRNGEDIGVVLATFPSDLNLYDAHFERLPSGEALIAFSREAVTAWNMQSATPIAVFKVDDAFGINSVDHHWRDDRLTSIVATTDGAMYELCNLQLVRRWFTEAQFITDITLVGERRLGLITNRLPIIELFEAQYREVLTTIDLSKQILDRPILGAHIRNRLREESEHFGMEPSVDLEGKFQNPHLGRIQIEGKPHVVVHVQLDFHVTDELVLLLDPATTFLSLVGHFMVPRKLLASYAIRSNSADGALTLIGALLSDFKLSYDLAIWAAGARTAYGIIFSAEGSTIRTKDDLIKVVFGLNDVCFAADDSGGLFKFSLNDGAWTEIHREPESRVKALSFHKFGSFEPFAL